MGGVVQPYPTYINPHTPIKEREREKEKAESTRRGTRQFLTQEKEKQKKRSQVAIERSRKQLSIKAIS